MTRKSQSIARSSSQMHTEDCQNLKGMIAAAQDGPPCEPIQSHGV